MIFLAHAGISDITPEQGESIQHFLSFVLPILMAALPLGWIFGRSFFFGSLAGLQIAVVLLIPGWVYRAMRRRKRGEIVSGAAATASYFLSCFLTNFLGMLILEGKFRR